MLSKSQINKERRKLKMFIKSPNIIVIKQTTLFLTVPKRLNISYSFDDFHMNDCK